MSRLCATLTDIANVLAMHDAQRKVTRDVHPVFSVTLMSWSEGPGCVAQDGDAPWLIVSDPRKKRTLGQNGVGKLQSYAGADQSLTWSPKYLKQVYDAGWLVF